MAAGQPLTLLEATRMIFRNGAKFADFDGKEANIYLMDDDPGRCIAINFCGIIAKDEQLFLDFPSGPLLIPDNSILSKNETDLTVGRYGVFIFSDTPAGVILQDLIAQRRAQGTPDKFP